MSSPSSKTILLAILAAILMTVPASATASPGLALPSLPHLSLRPSVPATHNDVLWTICEDTGQVLSGNQYCPVGASPYAPDGVVWDSANQDMYIVNSEANNLTVVKGATGSIVGSFNLTYGDARGGVFDPVTGNLYIPSGGSNELMEIDPSSGTLVNSTAIGPAAYGQGLDNATQDVYVACAQSTALYVVNASTMATSFIRDGPGYHPTSALWDPANGDVYVTNNVAGNISIIDGKTLTITSSFAAQPSPYASALDPSNGELFVIDGTYNVTEVNTANNAIGGTVSVGTSPIGIVYDPVTGDVYVENQGSADVTVISAASDTILGQVAVGYEPLGIAVDPLNGYVFIADMGSDSVSVIAPTGPQQYSVTFTEGGLPSGTSWSVEFNGSLQVTTGASLLFNAENGTYSYTVARVPAYTATPASGTLTVAGGNVAKSINFAYSVVSTSVGPGPVGIAYDAADGYIYVADGGSNNVSVLSGTKVIATVPAVNSPWGVAYDPQDGDVYVTNWGGGSGKWVVTVINGTHDVANLTYGSGGPKAPMGVAYDSGNGTIWVANDAGGGTGVTVLKGVKIVWNITKSPTGSSGIAYDPYANDIDTSNRSGDGELVVLNASGTADIIDLGASSEPYWESYDPLLNAVIISEYGYGSTFGLNGTLGTAGIGTVSTPMGSTVDGSDLFYITEYGSNAVGVYDRSQLVETFPVGTEPIDAAYDPANGFVYVTNRGSNNVSIVNASGSISVPLVSVSVSPGAATLAPLGNQSFAATPACSGGPCPSGTSYSWSLTNGLATLSAKSGAHVVVTAGSSSGKDDLFVNATLSGVTRQAGPIPITISSSAASLTSVSVSPLSASLSVNSTQVFSATPTCTGGPCPAGVTYAWHLTNSVGSLNSTTLSSVTFTAGPSPGAVGLYLNATLNAVTTSASPIPITVNAAGSNFLNSVSISPTSPSVAVNNTRGFTATPVCTSTCPGTVAYAWSLNNSLGILNATSGTLVTFSAGSKTGSVQLIVVATLNGVHKQGSANITVTAAAPTLSSVSISPVSVTIGVGNSSTFTAQPSCTGGACPPGAIYSWYLNNTSLGTLSPTSNSTETFTAGATPGSEILFAKATLNGLQATGLAVINMTKGTIPALTRLTLTNSPTVLVETGDAVYFNTTAACNVSPCPKGIGYIWSLNNSLGTLSSNTTANVVFTARSSAGTVVATVTATLNGGSKQASSTITITTAKVTVLSGVSISPTITTIAEGDIQTFTASAACSPMPCPSSVTYTWSTNHSLGTLNRTTGTVVQFTAGITPATVILLANASYNGRTVSKTLVFTIVKSSPSPSNNTSPASFLGLPGFDGYVLIAAILAVIMAAAAIIVVRKKKAEPGNGPQGYS